MKSLSSIPRIAS